MMLQTGSVLSGISLDVENEERYDQVDSAAALRKHLDLAFPDGEDCPTTFIYDIPELWDLEKPLHEIPELGEYLLHRHWGPRCGGDGTYHLNQYDVPAIVIYRLITSKRCRVTSDPEEADLFLVPYRPRAKTGAQHCAGGQAPDPEPYLMHLNEQTAHKHLFMLGKGHLVLSHCAPWWKQPTGLLQRAIRVAYSMPARPPPRMSFVTGYGPVDSRNLTLDEIARYTHAFDDDHVQFPHTFSVPYPSTGALGAKPVMEPWRNSESSRPILAYFMGEPHGRYGEVRQKIIDDCQTAGSPTCVHGQAILDLCQGIAIKEQALFCLEPGGDSPYRKSVFDDLSSGCIPVVFSPYLQLVAPWHWGHFRNESQVYINREDYLEGKIDLFVELQNIAASPRLQQLRRAIAANAHATQYSQSDYPGDGVERLLIGAHHAAQSWERRHAQ